MTSWLFYYRVLCSVVHSCLTLCNPMDCSLPGSSVQRILQARVPEKVDISSSRGSSWLRDRTCICSMEGGFFSTEPSGKPCVCQWLSCVWLFVTLWTVAHQAPLSMRFPRQAYWNGLPFPSPGDFPNQGIQPSSSVSYSLKVDFFTC